MSQIEYSIAWRRNDERLIEGARAFWASMGLTADAMEPRAAQLCNVAWAEGKVIASPPSYLAMPRR